MKTLGLVIVVLALVIAIVPLFTDCESQGRSIELANGKTIPMKCHWTGRAALAMAFPLAAVGVMMIVSRRKETRRALSVVAVVSGILVILLPTVLIGVCSSPDMICNMIERGVLILAGALTVAAGVVGLLLARGPEPSAA
jgi:uncharacterized membrane protein YkvI